MNKLLDSPVTLIGSMGLLMILFQVMEPVNQEALYYQHLKINEGQLYRLITGHFIHYDFNHLLSNLAGFSLLYLIFRGYFSLRFWAIALSYSAVCVGLGLYYVFPQITWYVGLSGVLYAMLVIGIFCIPSLDYKFKWLLFVAICFKLVLDQFGILFPLLLSPEMPIVYQAHHCGVIAGFIAGHIHLFIFKSCVIYRK